MPKVLRAFETFQPATVQPNSILEPSCFNGYCLIRKYRVTIEEMEESPELLEARLRKLWKNTRNRHMSNREAMRKEAKKLGINLEDA